MDYMSEEFTYYVYYDANRPMSAPEKLLLELLKDECVQASKIVERLLDA